MAMTLRLDEDLDARLTALAAAQRMSKQQMVARAVEDFVNRTGNRNRIFAIVDEVVADNAGLLQRLSQT